MEGKKQIRSTSLQLKKLTEYMSLNVAFANGEFSGPLGSRRMEAQWKELKDLLKELGPDKSIEQWKQTWRDLKRKARHANAEASAAYVVTGNPALPIPEVSDMANIILNTIGHECSTGIGPNESGIGRRIPMARPAEALPTNCSSTVTQDNIVIIEDYTEESVADTSAIVEDASQLPALAPTPHPRRTRRRHTASQNIENVPAAILDLQREQNSLLKRACDLMAASSSMISEHMSQSNEILKEQNNILKKQNDILRDQNRLQKKRRFTR